MWPLSTPEDNDFDEFNSTRSHVAFTKVSAFLGKWIFKWRFLKIY